MYTVFLVGKPEGKTKLGMSRRTWENNIKIYLKEIISRAVKLIRLAQRAFQLQIVVNIFVSFKVLWNLRSARQIWRNDLGFPRQIISSLTFRLPNTSSGKSWNRLSSEGVSCPRKSEASVTPLRKPKN